MLVLLATLLLSAAPPEDLSKSVGVTVSATSGADADKVVNRSIDRGWCEGAKGSGVREAVTLELSRPVPVKDVIVVISPDADASGAPYDVPSAVTVEAPDQPPVRLEAFGGHWELGTKAALTGAKVDRITLRIAGVAKPVSQETCLSEVQLDGFVLWPGLTEEDRAQVAKLMRDARAAFASCDAAGLSRVLSPRFHARLYEPAARLPENRDELSAADAEGLCRAGRLVMPAWEGALESSGYNGTYVRFELKVGKRASTWTVRHYESGWFLDSAETGR